MESVDMKKLETAIEYVQRIADGINPVRNIKAEDDEVLNNPNVIRCMFFVKEVLEEVKRNGGYIGKKAKKTGRSAFPLESLTQFVYQEDKPISKLIKQLNDAVDADVYRTITVPMVTGWLKQNGLLCEVYIQELGKNATVPTDEGVRIGMRAEKKVGQQGTEYMLVVYGKYAQEYIVRHMDEIVKV